MHPPISFLLSEEQLNSNTKPLLSEGRIAERTAGRKIFCVSFHKSGTTSLHEFFLSIGISSVHYPASVGGVAYQSLCRPDMTEDEIMTILRPVIDGYDAHSDVPWPGLVEGIIRSYPNALFILLTRNPQEWWRSLSRHWRLDIVPCALSNFEQIQYRRYLPGKTVAKIHDRDMFLSAYQSHISRVRSAIPSQQLFEARLDDPMLSEMLSDFLGLPSPANFPRMQNKTAKQPKLLLIKRVFRFVMYFVGMPMR